MCFSPYLCIGGGGVPKGSVRNLLMHFFTLGSSKIQVFETCFSDTASTSNDNPSHVKHVLGRIYVFFPYLGCVLLGVDSLRGGLAEGKRIAFGKGGGVRKTLVLIRSKAFSVALEAKGRRSLRGMPEVSSFRACLKACKAARAWALPRVPGGRACRVVSVRFAMPFRRRHAACW